MTLTLDHVTADQRRVDNLRANLNRVRAYRRQLLAAEPTDPEVAARTLAKMDAEILDLERELGEAEPPEPDALEVLRLARGPLALRIAEGDEQAHVELADLEARIRDIEEKAELDLLAGVERQRVAQEAAQEALCVKRARLESELAAKVEQRTAALLAFQAAILRAAEFVPEFRTLDDEVHDLGVRLGSPTPSLRGTAVELAAVHLTDAGLTSPTAEVLLVRAVTRARLLADWPSEAVSPEPGQATVAQCSVCTHDDRAAIESDLAAGASLRELEERYGVSRSALSRHGKHV